MDINGSVMLITGASSGIGAATARLASAQGACLILAARREDRIQALADELGNALALRCDVTNAAEVVETVRIAGDHFGRIDVLVNNAGQGLQGSIEEIQVDDFRALLELNVLAPFMTMQAVLPLMRAQQRGSIVNVSSGIIFTPLPNTGAYNSSKAALATLSNVARAELIDTGIVVSTMFPFITETEFIVSLKAGSEQAKKMEAGVANYRHSPEQVAAAIIELIRSGNERADLVPVQFGGTYKG
ncbi:SDR family oxidoreductase [Sphingomonas ginsenosidivorax]|uniref:SDR family oxidoreductase n=1 Tax=Sphingomonas ginsenosidivorax TaxID=862135 RepID=A0A5C6U545_9SPHN|nr:SDR family oxidoreductase [Sphingomonas ginsenosidivorax]TXC67987.1 SDR family oxidoreductase [Sphingomonas ginsenosidivorax]